MDADMTYIDSSLDIVSFSIRSPTNYNFKLIKLKIEHTCLIHLIHILTKDSTFFNFNYFNSEDLYQKYNIFKCLTFPNVSI